MDCTNGTWDCEYYGHMGANDNLRMREKLLANGAADEHTVFVANHFSHNGLVSYEEMQKRLPGFIISYDGLELNV
jgi:phosphoribosyl 1,2-cyclic phosphate phosphodiesterase